MEFKIKHRKEREYGTIKKVLRFAFFPVEIDGKYIWLERYYKYKEWRKGASNRIRYSGMFVTSYYDAWVTIKYERVHKTKKPVINSGEEIYKRLTTPLKVVPADWESVKINFWTHKEKYWRKKKEDGGYQVFYPNGTSIGGHWNTNQHEYIVKACSFNGGYKHLIGTKVRIAILWTGFALSENFDYFFYGDLEPVQKSLNR